VQSKRLAPEAATRSLFAVHESWTSHELTGEAASHFALAPIRLRPGANFTCGVAGCCTGG